MSEPYRLSNSLFFTTQREAALDHYTQAGFGNVTRIMRHGDHGMPVPIEGVQWMFNCEAAHA